MSTYIVTAKGPSLAGYQAQCELVYLGSYERYAASAWAFEGTKIFINGDLGPHCTGCAAPGDILCDYPVGDGKTCDRPMCSDHSHKVGTDIDYCDHHHAEWLAFSSTNGIMDQLTALAESRVPKQPDGAND